MKKGLTARKAAKAVDAVVDTWKVALWCGDAVETPCGTLQAKITKGKPRQTMQRSEHIQTKETKFRLVQFPGRRRVVKLRPNRKLDLTPLPPPPKPETAENIAERRAASELLGRPTNQNDMNILQLAVGAHPRIPGQRVPFARGSLLRRLRDFQERAWHFNSVESLARQISQHYWL